ncbi:MAG: dipeptide epimerase [Bacteroidales bacterium]|jgi:L-alanine-DL-glutamate epimerase-like enolase superfamily enzyme|nr:dipeptide epimerase [Bacteroidales bacterium]MCB9027666.1 dipeptide epimerase [Bacteroidales bacterium]NLE35455.1 dipeptide epimerase [Bacteroidales bacterium]
MKKRDFIKIGGLAAGAVMVGCKSSSADQAAGKSRAIKKGAGTLKLSYRPYELQLRHVFTVASSSRTTTPVVLTTIEYDGVTGFGEASMPPYLGESHESVLNFLSKVNLEQFSDPFLREDILAYIDGIMPGNYAAKASLDIALHDLTGKLLGQPWFRLWGLDPLKAPVTSFTIGIDTADVVREKTLEAGAFRQLKIKMGRDNDKEMIDVVRSVTDVPVFVDVNQGWKDREYALEMAHYLNERGALFIEQPMPKEQIDDIAWLTERSPLPIVADEALQTVEQLLDMKGIYNGINIKLMKCGGMDAAYKMITMARQMGMKVLIGCMTETSCAVSAAAQLSPLVDWADLDGNLLISNDIYDGMTVVDGRIVLPDRPGIGIIEKKS